MIICGIFVCVDGTRITDPEQVFYSWVVCVHGWFVFMGGLCSWVVFVHMSTVQLKRERQIMLVILETLTPTSNEPTIQ